MHINAGRLAGSRLTLSAAVSAPACTNRSDIGKMVGHDGRGKRKDSIFHKGHPFDLRSLSFYEESPLPVARVLFTLAVSTDSCRKNK